MPHIIMYNIIVHRWYISILTQLEKDAKKIYLHNFGFGYYEKYYKFFVRFLVIVSFDGKSYSIGKKQMFNIHI